MRKKSKDAPITREDKKKYSYKAKQNLILAKEQEKEKLNNNYSYQRIDNKTLILRKNEEVR